MLINVLIWTIFWCVNFTVSNTAALIPIPDLGSNQLVPGITVHGAVIVGDQTNDQRAAFSSLPATVASQVNYNHNDMIRNSNFQQMNAVIPVPLCKWPTVYARPCPHYAKAQKSTDKGNGLSHYQIWLEFIFFDHDLLEAVTRKPPEYLVSNAWSSNSATFQSFANRSFHKNGVPFLEDDIIIILEDSAYSAVNSSIEMTSILRSELSNMTTDLVQLGWCDSSQQPPQHQQSHSHTKKFPHLTHSCMYAYAVTRRGVRQLVKYFDVCSAQSLEEQVRSFTKYGWLTTRQARVGSYSHLPRVEHPLGALSSGTGSASSTVESSGGAGTATATTATNSSSAVATDTQVKESSSSVNSRVTQGIFLQVKDGPNQ